MSSIAIFKCDICGNEVRLDLDPYASRHSFTYESDYRMLYGSLRKVSDACAPCLIEIQSALNEAIKRRKDLTPKVLR